MKNVHLLIAFVAVLFFSCKKEMSEENNGNPPGGGGGSGQTGNLLTRNVIKDRSDSTVIDYSYDASKRVTRLVYTASAFDFDTRIVRNSSGIITEYIQKSSLLAGFGIDSFVTKVNYNSSQSKYMYSVISYSLFGFDFKDSTSYKYDSGGKLISAVNYSGDITGYAQAGKTDYTYDGSGNLATEKYYEFEGTSYTQLTTVTHTYDTKVNPLKLGAEAIILNQTTSYGPNNVVVTAFQDLEDATNNYTYTLTLTYNTANKPKDGTAAEQPSGATYDLKYYYQ